MGSGPKRRDIPPGTLAMLILKTINRCGPLHGFGIAQFIAQTTEGVLQVEEGTLYPALQRLVINGWVNGTWKQTENKRRARYYSLTADGRKQLRAEVSEFEHIVRAITRVIQPTTS
jgi:PadR family transcriptional regulator, regulatory protein PadR